MTITITLLSAAASLHAQSQLGLIEDRFGCQADRKHTGAMQNDHMGFRMDAGDWNGDGIDDLLVGGVHAFLGPCETPHPIGAPNVGNVWLFLGNADNTPTPPARHFVNVPVMDDFGPAVAFIGDIDDDGGEDIAIGLPTTGSMSLGVNTGAVWIFLSPVPNLYADPDDLYPPPPPISFTDPTVSPDILIEAPNTGMLGVDDQAHFGFSLALAGDVNGDGYEDLVIGAPGPARDANLQPRPGCDPPALPRPAGHAFIFAGSDPATWGSGPEFSLWASLSAADVISPAGGPEDRFGWSVAGVGNVNGDLSAGGKPLDDVVVGGIEAGHKSKLDYNDYGTGFAHLYLGQPGATAVPTAILIQPSESNEEDVSLFGFAIAGRVDLTGDGAPEILIGCPQYSPGDDTYLGGVYAYTWDALTGGVQDGFPGQQPIVLSTSEPTLDDPFLRAGARFGWSLAPVGQYDSYALDPGPREFLVGALRNENPRTSPMALGPPFCDASDPGQGGGISGRVFVLYVDPGAVPGQAEPEVQCVYKGEDASKARLGSSVAAGDFDGDGLIDVAAGAFGWDPASPAQEFGRIYVFSNIPPSP